MVRIKHFFFLASNVMSYPPVLGGSPLSSFFSLLFNATRFRALLPIAWGLCLHLLPSFSSRFLLVLNESYAFALNESCIQPTSGLLSLKSLIILCYHWNRASLVVQQWRVYLQCRRCRRCELDPWVGKIPWRRAWQPTPVFLPKKIP